MQRIHDTVSGMPQKKLEYFLRMSAPQQRLLELQNAKVRRVVHIQMNVSLLMENSGLMEKDEWKNLGLADLKSDQREMNSR
jgi:hypothetical protein